MTTLSEVVAPLGSWQVVGRVADAVTIVAAALALLALYPLYTTWRTRPKIAIRMTPPSYGIAEVQVLHERGSAGIAKYVTVGWGVLSEDNVSMLGEGHLWAEWDPYKTVRVEFVEGEPAGVTGDSAKEWMKVRIPSNGGFMVEVSWQHPLRPWRRVQKVVLWTRSDRTIGAPPRELGRREAKRVSDAALRRLPVASD